MAKAKKAKTGRVIDTVLLPEWYDGPAYQLEDGRTLFISKWPGNQWAVVYLDGKSEVPRHFRSEALPIEKSMFVVKARLWRYAKQQGLTKVQ